MPGIMCFCVGCSLESSDMYCANSALPLGVDTCMFVLQHKQLDTIQSAANKIASEARKLSNDPEYESPFCKNAAKEGIAFKGWCLLFIHPKVDQTMNIN